MRQFLVGAKLFTGEETLAGRGVLVEDGRIAALLPEAADTGAGTVVLPEGSLIVPGFIDTQANGGGGVLVNDDASGPALARMVEAHRRFGTTGLLPTVITDTPERMRLAADGVADAALEPGSGILGVHLEGPFISLERKGIHDARLIRPVEAADLAFLTGLAARLGPARLLLSVAPETVGDDVLRQLKSAGLVLAAAHSAATAERTFEAVAAGITGFTHLFNAMPPIAGRQPGIAAAALADPGTWCGIIADGFHVHPLTLKLALGAKPRGRVFLVTDAMPPLGTEAESFTLYGATIHRRGGRLVDDQGTLAGADLDMAAAVRNAVRLLGVSLEEALRMASLYPASFLGLDLSHGRIAPGYAADLALLTGEVKVAGTWIGGAWRSAE